MSFRSLTQQQQAELVASFKYSQTHPNDLAKYYGVSITTVKNVLADHGLVTINSRKTPEQNAMLELLQALNIQSVHQLKQKLNAASNLQEQFNRLSVPQRVAIFTQSFVAAKGQPPELTDFKNTNSKDAPDVKQCNAPSPQLQSVQRS
ncbi:hypothetical protein ABTD98_13940 [Acinetobacter baumannii]|uniref:hypothetical protein n=1 Tax=Acinetobacter baumannii TaxID=470 RepID=UPI0026E05F49|nr:hypothetical protein [Acinetobacter baumannii]MDO5926333.1 hypothetical protein [Acinetobacter baumannii]HCJ6328397.1 hypothetical protein [Acinetobacter baumannii]HCJ6595705.1 hypothetical protein [Acinetobacter baumannii]HCJ6599592.1 hypothetical protein [Acinetobacter baumannii]HCJ6666072.1 hypothetical protein [Acinetobacter baumannii]